MVGYFVCISAWYLCLFHHVAPRLRVTVRASSRVVVDATCVSVVPPLCACELGGLCAFGRDARLVCFDSWWFVCLTGCAARGDGVPLRQSAPRATRADPHPQEQPGPGVALRVGSGQSCSASSSCLVKPIHFRLFFPHSSIFFYFFFRGGGERERETLRNRGCMHMSGCALVSA